VEDYKQQLENLQHKLTEAVQRRSLILQDIKEIKEKIDTITIKQNEWYMMSLALQYQVKYHDLMNTNKWIESLKEKIELI